LLSIGGYKSLAEPTVFMPISKTIIAKWAEFARDLGASYPDSSAKALPLLKDLR
jgi:hypothetical protein